MMRRFALAPIMAGVFFLHGGIACAQDSLQTLLQELKEAKEAHNQITSQALANFFSQIDPAMASPDAAVALYQQAGGALPDPSPVIKENENETATEKANRLALDQANLARLGAILQLQCGMLHYAALFVTKPDAPDLKAQWTTWLKAAAQAYPLAVNVPASAATAPHPPGNGAPESRHHKRDDVAPKAAAAFDPSDIKGKALKDTVYSKYLGFNAWGDKEQGGWAVKDLPKLYRNNVLDPLRATPSAATLAAWDAFIAMANADERDDDKWAHDIYPPLQFDRASDDYLATPGTEKLEGLVSLIKANPTNTHADEWITRVAGFMDDYKAKHGGAPAPPPATATAPTPSAPGVVVTTEQQGDATIITTHSNSAPISPAPPH